jgi:hypothetical protein
MSAGVVLVFGVGAHVIVDSITQPGAPVPDAVAASIMGGCAGVYSTVCGGLGECRLVAVYQSPGSLHPNYKGLDPYWCDGDYDCGACYQAATPCGT